MTLQSCFQKLADAQIQGIHLSALVGAYELTIPISGTVQAGKAAPYWLIVNSARIIVRSSKGQRDLCTAMPNYPVRVRQYENQTPPLGFELKALLQPSQLSALEDMRNGGDLDFDVIVAGTTGRGQQENDAPEYQTLRIHVPQSTWIMQLKSAGAMHILLLEVPMPVSGASPRQEAVFNHVSKAYRHLAHGDFADCISECRKATEELEQPGQQGVFGRLSKKETREVMDKPDRSDAILATVQHFTHLAAHSGSKGGTADFNQADARLILSLTAAFAAYRASHA